MLHSTIGSAMVVVDGGLIRVKGNIENKSGSRFANVFPGKES